MLHAIRIRVLASLVLLLSVCAAAQADSDITVDVGQRHQVVHGMGAHMTWVSQAERPAFPEAFVEDLGATACRVSMEGRVCKEVATVDDIKWQDFDWKRNDQIAVAASCVKQNPKEFIVLGTVFTPPHWMKEGAELQHGDESCGGSLREDRIPHFARFLSQYLLGIHEKFGIDLYALSLQNELLFKEPYQSCVYTPELYYKTVMAVGAEFEKAGIKTRIMGPEDMTFWPDRFVGFVRKIMDDPQGKQYLDFFCSHGYTDGVKSEGGSQSNSALWKALRKYNKELWMTETSGEKPDWDGGLTMAAKIHNGLVYGNVSGWSYGSINDPNGSGALMTAMKPTTKYYTSKQYYKFIRPGAVRVSAGPDAQGNGLNVSAFMHEANNTLTIVLLNRGEATKANLKIVSAPAMAAGFETYRSSATESCVKIADMAVAPGGGPAGTNVSVDIPAASIVTLFGKTTGPWPAATALQAEPELEPAKAPAAAPPAKVQANAEPAHDPAMTEPVKNSLTGKVALRVDCGATAGSTDEAGATWVADQMWGGDKPWGAVGGQTVARDLSAVPGTQAPAVYKTVRHSLAGYRFNVPNGKYTVRLHFAETYDGNAVAGGRVFAVWIQGKSAFDKIDPFQDAGRLSKPLVKEAKSVEVAEGKLIVEFVKLSEVHAPEINGIEILAE